MSKKSNQKQVGIGLASRRNAGLFATAVVCGALLAAHANAQAPSDLVVASWGGAYTQSQNEAMFKPFMAKTGGKILIEDYTGGLAEIRAQVKTGNIKWDVVDVELAEAIRGCDEGLFERIDPKTLPDGSDGTPAKADFKPGLVTRCAVGTISYANVFAYDRSKVAASPTTLEDFFDLKKFPGKRGLRKSPNVALEWALLADGVPLDQVYTALSTPAGVDRAFRKLDTIKSSVVWWTAGAQPAQLLASGDVVMTSVYHGRIYDAVKQDKKPFAVVWDGAITAPDLFAVVKGSRKAATAMDFIRFATGSQPLADTTRTLPYAPARDSSLKLVDDQVKPWLPNTGHRGRSMQTDAAWWSDHADELNQRFAAWMAK